MTKRIEGKKDVFGWTFVFLAKNQRKSEIKHGLYPIGYESLQ
jgi:hypothetical protein